MTPVFRIPYIAGETYSPGPQPNNPGESVAVWGGHMGMRNSPMPWPGAVPVMWFIASNSGIPRNRAQMPVNNSIATHVNEMVIPGFVGKSQG